MSRKERITQPGFYHVISRGVERRNIFLDSDDFVKFLAITYVEFKAYEVILHSFCLMTNHYHLLIETKQSNISSVMKRLNSLYSIYFNKKYKRSGHLWHGRFKSWYVFDELYLKSLVKYIFFGMDVEADYFKEPNGRFEKLKLLTS